MDGCRLCGGKVVNGRCTECGLDNRKSDRDYRLNVHNEKEMQFHEGSCEKHLNHPSEKAASEYRKSTQPRKSTDTHRSAETRRSTSEPMSARRRRELKKRRQTGTIQRRGRKKWLLVIILLLYGISFLFNMAERELGKLSLVEEWLPGQAEHEQWDQAEEVPMEAEQTPAPVPEKWNTSDSSYYAEVLTTGFYTAGYEFPAGTYQFYCPQESVWLYWKTPESDWWESVCLYSEAYQKSYAKDFGICSFHEYSEVIELPEDTLVYVEEAPNGVELTGVGQQICKEHEPQNLLERVELRTGMIAGEDFPAGVYDAVFESQTTYANLDLRYAGDSIWVSVNPEQPKVKRIPLTEGTKVTVDYYGEERGVELVPSY